MSENPEKKPTTWEKLSSLFPLFPQIAIFLVILLSIGGIGLLLYFSNPGIAGANTSNVSRGLITILVAVVTVAIAITLTLSVVLSNASDYKERFALGKEILTILIGVLGTIIGFYFGSAPVDIQTSANVATATSTANNSTANSKSISGSNANQVSNLTVPSNQRLLAMDLELQGFDALLNQDFEKASTAFQNAYNSWATYHNVDEINHLVQKNKEKFKNADETQKTDIWTEILCEIDTKFPWGMTVETRVQLQKLIKNKNYSCSKYK